MADEETRGLKPDEKVLYEARKRWKRSQDNEQEWRGKFLLDLKFRHGDADNGWQWPDDLRSLRSGDNRPCLTMNIVRQHNLMISNDLRKNKSSVHFVGTGNGASQESANVFKDLYRHIEWRSNAQSAYTLARNFQIDGGMGFWRIITDYVSDDSMDQEILIRPVLDPLMVYLDPDAQELDTYSDGQYAFVFDTMPRDDFRDAYPKFRDLAGAQALGDGSFINQGVGKDDVTLCEYFRRVQVDDTLVSFVSGGERKTMRKSAMHPDLHTRLVGDPMTQTRAIAGSKIEWFLIAGEKILARTEWAGKYIPIVPVVGEVTTVSGRIDRKGHTRAMKDAQRMYNFNSSSQVEFVALQGKSPWVIPQAGVEDLEDIWNTANRVNHAFLPYNHIDDDGQPIPPPTKPNPPNFAPAYEQGMNTAYQQMMMTSGQYQNAMGEQGNERTGAAIGKRQQQSDTAVFHFQDNYEQALIYTGRQIIDLVPKIYDTKRVLRIQAEDGTESDLAIDPTARQAYFEEVAENNALVKRTLNPQVGEYAVAASVGPSLMTKREETLDALGMILSQNPGLTAVVGDLLLGSMDFDKAQEAAKRMKRMVPPQALGVGPTQNEQVLQQQVQQLQAALQKSLEHVAKTQLKLVGKDQMRDIDVYDAETKRISALQKMLPTDPQGLQTLIHQLVQESMTTHLGPIIQANANDIDPTPQADAPSGPQGAQQAAASASGGPPLPGAVQHPDGQWYLADPTRRGKYLRVGSLATQGTSGGRP